jgi:hypothetical protein
MVPQDWLIVNQDRLLVPNDWQVTQGWMMVPQDLRMVSRIG